MGTSLSLSLSGMVFPSCDVLLECNCLLCKAVRYGVVYIHGVLRCGLLWYMWCGRSFVYCAVDGVAWMMYCGTQYCHEKFS